MTHKSNASHIGSSLSLIDIISVIVSNVNLGQRNELGDDLIISKGHAAAGAYAVLANAGYIPHEYLDNYCQDGAKLGGHLTSTYVPFVPLSTGSLGHGLPFALGRALAKKKLGLTSHTFVVLSDGECDEGSNWEAALVGAHLELAGLSIVIDRNYLQSLESTESTIKLEPLAEKWSAFNWDVLECDGHNHQELKAALLRKSEKPKVTIAKTIKGYGVSFMQNSIAWHYKSPSLADLDAALFEIRDNS
jgi:transketolase